MEIVAAVARIAIGLILVAAGVSKLRTRTWGLLALEAGTPRAVVVSLPAIEVLLGAALIVQIFHLLFAWVSVALFVLFTGFVIQRIRTGSTAGCNCFGSKRSQEPVDRYTVIRNVIMLIIAVVGTLA